MCDDLIINVFDEKCSILGKSYQNISQSPLIPPSNLTMSSTQNFENSDVEIIILSC